MKITIKATKQNTAKLEPIEKIRERWKDSRTVLEFLFPGSDGAVVSCIGEVGDFRDNGTKRVLEHLQNLDGVTTHDCSNEGWSLAHFWINLCAVPFPDVRQHIERLPHGTRILVTGFKNYYSNDHEKFSVVPFAIKEL